MKKHGNDGRWARDVQLNVRAEASATDGPAWWATTIPFRPTWLIALALLSIAWAQAAAAPPVANPDGYSVHANEVLTVPAASGLLANDSDADADPINVTSIQAPSNGTINIAADGSFEYTPNTGFVGSEVLEYTITAGGEFAQGTVTIDVTNAAPTANPDSYSVHANEVLTVPAASGLLANDSDTDADPISVTSIQAPSNGTINIAADGSFEYTPNAGFVGSEVLIATISDGIEFSQSTVTIDVTNAPPVANPDSYAVAEDTVLTVTAASGLLANDSDADADPISVTSIQAPSNGTINIAADGSFEYTPNTGFVGFEALDYTISDGIVTAVGTVTIDVGDNSAPIANPDSYSVLENTVLTVGAASGVLANDTDPDGNPLIVDSFQQSSNGTVNMAADGSFTFTPDPGYVGTETLDYTISDGRLSATNTYTLQVVAAQPMPAVPTLGNIGVVVLVMLVMAMGVLVVRRRNQDAPA